MRVAGLRRATLLAEGSGAPAQLVCPHTPATRRSC